MQRLTNEMRGAIRNRLLAKAFETRNLEHRRVGNDLAVRIMKNVMGEKLHALMLTLPDGWVYTTCTVKAMVGAAWSEIFCDPMRMPYSKNGTALAVFSATDPLGADIEAYLAERRKIKDDGERLFREITATLGSYYSVEKLVDGWPEVEPFLAQPKTPKATLPAVNISLLNAKIGLPVEEAA